MTAGVFGALTAPAQGADQLSFEVVSIKPATASVPAFLDIGCNFSAGTHFRCVSITLQQLISLAFRLGDAAIPRWQIVGAPDWATTSRFEFTAVFNRTATQEEVSAGLAAILRPVIEERFALKTHADRRAMPVYALVNAAPDGALGPNLHPASTDCPQPPSDAIPRGSVPTAGKSCWTGSFRAGSIVSGALAMSKLATTFTALGLTDRIVVDRSGLSGKFDLNLHWAPGLGGTTDSVNADQSGEPSLFTAVREQLGLKLEPRTELTDVLVIDQAKAPTPN